MEETELMNEFFDINDMIHELYNNIMISYYHGETSVIKSPFMREISEEIFTEWIVNNNPYVQKLVTSISDYIYP